MGKMDYGRIDWKARTNWQFCGSYGNLREMWNRYWNHVGIKVSIEEFGYMIPFRGLAFKEGDVVKYTCDSGEQVFVVMDNPLGSGGYLYVILPDGHQAQIAPSNILERIAPAGIPDELMALARAEAAAASVDLSRCPLKKAGTCMETER